MPAEATDEGRILQDLFFEQEVPALATNYRHGVLRSLAVLALALLRPAPTAGAIAPRPGESIGVGFFANEISALASAPVGLRMDRIIALDLHSLPFVRRQLGVLGMLREAAGFVRRALSHKGARYAGRLTYPLLGWLLYKTFRSMLARTPDVTVITTNMQHPASIGVAWAAKVAGHRSVFLEHATTPRLVFRERSYDRYLVQFPHTRQMLIELGVPADRVQAVQADPIRPVLRLARAARRIGVCVNILDPLDQLGEVVAALRARGLSVAVRVHDADFRAAHIRQLAHMAGAEFESARGSRIETFLDGVDLVVAGNTNVIADALRRSKPILYFWAGPAELFDYYGLVRYYGLPHASDRAGFEAALARMSEP